MSSVYGATGSGNKVPSGYKAGQLQQFTPEQMQLFQSLFGHLRPDSFLSRIASGDQGAFEQMEAPALRQFGQLQGQLASRFSGMGMGARRSSGFQNTANQAASEFAQDLQSRRLDLTRQALQDLMGMSSNLLSQRPYEQFLVEKKPSFLQSILGAAGSGLGQGIGMAGGAGITKLLGLLGLA